MAHIPQSKHLANELKEILAAAPVGLFLADKNGGCTFVNTSWCEIAGMTLEQAMGDGWKASLHLDDRERIFQAWIEAAQAGKIFEAEYRFQNLRTARIHWVLGRARFLPSSSVGYVGTVTDISAQKNSEEDHQRSLRFLDSIVENVPQMLFLKDAKELRFVRFNRAGEDLLGIPRSDMLGKSDFDFFPPEQARAFVEKDRSVLAGDAVFVIPEEPIDTAKNGRRYLRTRKVALRGPNGEAEYLLGISEDITIEKRAAEEMKNAQRAAEEATRLKSQFLANMSHEIRTPMNAVIGMADLLLQTNLDALQREYVSTIASSSGFLLEILNDILDYSRIEAGKLTLCRAPFDPVDLARSVERLFAQRCCEKSMHFELRLEVPDTLRVIGDENRVRQIMVNLVSNAVKFTPEGGRVTLEMQAQRGADGLTIVVRDTGIGIAQDKLHVIFESFAQADPGSSRSYGGTGLGLSIVRQLAGLMGGSISVSSTLGRGSAFTCHLPLATETPALDGDAATSAKSSVLLNGVRVLLAEDNPINQRLARHVLEKAGCEVVIADNGEECLKLRSSAGAHIVLMDVQMPVLDGLAATARIRAWERKNSQPHIPIIAMTAHAMSGDRERFLEAGMNDYVSKPFDRLELLRRICEHTRKS